MKKIRYIMNPISGTSDKDGIPKMIDAKLDHEQFEYEIITTNHAGHASELATEAKDSHMDIVVWVVMAPLMRWRAPLCIQTRHWASSPAVQVMG